MSGASEFCPCPDAGEGGYCATCPGRLAPETTPGVIAESLLLAPAVWRRDADGARVIGLDAAELTARLRSVPDDIAGQTLALCLAAEYAALVELNKAP